MSATLIYGELDLNDGVTYKLMREGFKYPPPENQQTFSDSPLAPGQKPSDNWKPNNRELSFSIFVNATDATALNIALNALYSAAYSAESTVTWCPKGGTDVVYFKAYRAPAIDPSSYFRTEYRAKHQAIVSWSCQGAPYPHLDRVTMNLVKGLGLNDSFEKYAGIDFENWTDTGWIQANGDDYLSGDVSFFMATPGAEDTCSLEDEDYLAVDEFHAHNAKLYAYKNSGTLTLDYDLHCYRSAYSSCSFPTASLGITPGMPISIVCVVNHTNAWDDGQPHLMFFTNDLYPNGPPWQGFEINATIFGTITLGVWNGTDIQTTGIAIDSTNWAPNVDHIIVATIDAANNQRFFVDGVEGFVKYGECARETAVGADSFFGTHPELAEFPIGGSELCAIFNGIITDAEAADISAMTDWTTLPGLTAATPLLLFDGTDAVKDSVHNIPATMTGTPATDTLMGVTAPVFLGNDSAALATLSLLTAYNPAATTWMDVLKVAGSPVVYPSDSSLSPRFPAGTSSVKREIRHDTTVGEVSLDSLYFGDTEYVVGHELEGAMAICIPPGDCPGDVPARARLHVGSTFSSGPWSPQGSRTAHNLNGISALDATHAWAVGDYGVLSFYNGLTWTPQASGTYNRLIAVSAYDSTHVWAVGDDGTFVHWDGSTWGAGTFTPPNLTMADAGFEVSGDWQGHATSPDRSDQDSTDYHSGSHSWCLLMDRSFEYGHVAVEATSSNRQVINVNRSYTIAAWHRWGNSPGNTVTDFALVAFYDVRGNCLGNREVAFYIHDTTWTQHTLLTVTPADYPDGTFAMGIQFAQQGTGMNANPARWDDITITPSVLDLYGVCAVSTTGTVAVGEAGLIIRIIYGDTSWTEKASGTAYNLNAIDAVDASSLWAVGDHGTVLWSGDGTTWYASTTGTTVNLRAVYALDSTHIWAVGDYGKILFCNGYNWAPQTSPTGNVLLGVYAYDSTHVWAVGGNGILLFFNGTAWTVQSSGTSNTLMSASGVGATSVWAAGQGGTIVHGVVAVGAMPMTNLVVGQRDTYAENWNPVQDATGATEVLLYSRHGQYYRAMAAGANNKFRFPVGSHRGRYVISLGIAWTASTAYDQVTIDCYLEAADGTRLTATTVALPSLEMNDPGWKFKEVAFATSGTRLIDVSLPTHFVPQGTNEDNIYQVFEVKANGSLSDTVQTIDCMTLIPVDKCVELSGLSNNFVILDSEGRANLVSQDGSLDTATMYDPTKMLDSPRFEADPNGMNLVVLAGDIVDSEERLTPKLDIVITFEPNVLMST